MASEIKSKKRKAATPSFEGEKAKKVKNGISESQSKKRKATEDATPSVDKKPKIPKGDLKTKSHATKQEVFGFNSAAFKEENANLPTQAKFLAALENTKDSNARKSKKPMDGDTESKFAELGPENDEGGEFSGESEDEDIDDQTAALLKGFESDEDDRDVEGPEIDFAQPHPALRKLEKKIQKKVDKAAGKQEINQETPGVLYIGRIPHGFYENEMRQYFKQFGDITRLRLSRNRKTGQSKHFAFIEFKSADVAEIVAKTMDNYLLFNHVLKCKIVPAEQVHQDLWKGANKRFKKVPWNKLEGRKLAQPMTADKWEVRIEREEKRRAEKAEKLKGMGYEFAIPKLKSTKDIFESKSDNPLLTSGSEAPMEAIVAPKSSGEPIMRGKKFDKLNDGESKTPSATEAPEVSEAATVSMETEKRGKKNLKKASETVAASGADKPVVEETSNEHVSQIVAPLAVEKSKKSKKENKKKEEKKVKHGV